MRRTAVQLFKKFFEKNNHPHQDILAEVLSGQTVLSSSGYPYIAEDAFSSFLDHVPHLFQNGLDLLLWLDRLKTWLETDSHKEISGEQKSSFLRSVKVIKTVVLTASITSPSDLRLLRQILSSMSKFGLTDLWLKGELVDAADFAKKNKLSIEQLDADLSFLHSRNFLTLTDKGYGISSDKVLKNIFKDMPELSEKVVSSNWYEKFRQLFLGQADETLLEEIQQFISFSPIEDTPQAWYAGHDDIEIGYRVISIVLALRNLDRLKPLKKGLELNSESCGFAHFDLIKPLFIQAGYLDQKSKVTVLGERVFARGSGPFGIIYTYHPYLEHHHALLQGESVKSWVSRGENVAASQDANRKTFEMANQALDNFCEKYEFSYNVFIEHAVGQGEATRQRLELSGSESIQYFGADLEDAAIDRAVELQKKGELPKNMKFVRNADIGKPKVLIDSVKADQFNTENSVMIVGNGFHEVRGQTNDAMVEVFKGYCDAGIILLFTEESGLMDEDLLSTGWNTYHAGFRYVHAISGQGLRPSLDKSSNSLYSWSKCASLGGYDVLADYTTRTRTIYPHPRKDGYNPAISVNYFCVPKALTKKLGI
jgi:hypothetical protein